MHPSRQIQRPTTRSTKQIFLGHRFSVHPIDHLRSAIEHHARMTPHPYYPPSVDIPGYVPNDRGALALIFIFASACVAIFLATYLLTTKQRPQISTGDLLTAQWFALCGCIHLFFEGYYSLNIHTLPSKQTLFGQLWKEYALSDSRYLVPNSFVHSMESITAFAWGPLSFVLVFLISRDYHLRHPVQLVVSLGQLYGDVLYYMTCLFELVVFGTENSRPEKGYFWGYFVLLNAFWVVIPSGLVWESVVACGRAFKVSKAVERGVNGMAKKVL
ncbi:Emopamil binding protein-domain-containing protein [Aspergillus floccosus]